jgi:glycosyltransferase involved in cell wall biosynthesis
MNSGKRRLSIGLPVYNGERYLELAAESLLSQSYEDFELVIADNASTDRTVQICRELARMDSRVRYLRHRENIGVAPNHNFTVDAARGELFRWAADDDLIERTGIEKCVELLDDAGPDTVLAFPQTEVIGEHGEHLSYWSVQGAVCQDRPHQRLRALLETPGGHLSCGFLPPAYGVVRTAVLRSTPLYRYFYASDVILVVELALRGKLAEVPEPLFMRRQHAAQSGGWSTSTGFERDAFTYPGFRGYPMPRTRVNVGFFDAVLDAPLTRNERRRCLAAVTAALFRDQTVRNMLGEMRRAAQWKLQSRLGRKRDPS